MIGVGCSEPGSVDGQAAERERGYLTGLWKKRGRKPILPPSFLPLFLSSYLRRRRLIIVAREELKLFSWPVTSATPPPSFVVFVLALCRSLGGNFPAIRAHSLRLFLQAPYFLSQSVRKARNSDDVRLIHHYFHAHCYCLPVLSSRFH